MAVSARMQVIEDSARVERAGIESLGGRAWVTFLRAHASLLRTLDRELQREAEISLADFDVLVQLALADEDALRMSDLARRTLVSRSGMTRRVAQLEELGLVERRPGDRDRRSVTVSLTAAGAAVLRRAVPIHGTGIARHFVDKLTDDELATLDATLAKVFTDCDFG
jgi:DNA-binding MarR family transcriptional regulator